MKSIQLLKVIKLIKAPESLKLIKSSQWNEAKQKVVFIEQRFFDIIFSCSVVYIYIYIYIYTYIYIIYIYYDIYYIYI